MMYTRLGGSVNTWKFIQTPASDQTDQEHLPSIIIDPLNPQRNDEANKKANNIHVLVRILPALVKDPPKSKLHR